MARWEELHPEKKRNPNPKGGYPDYGGGAGGSGGVRIIWGAGRSFPHTYTTEDPSIADSRNPGDGR